MQYEERQRLRTSVGWWMGQGYTALDIGLLHDVSEDTARRIGYEIGENRFGSKRVYGKWRKALLARPEIPENLVEFHKRVLRLIDPVTCRVLGFDKMKMVLGGDFNEERVQGWIDVELPRRAARNSLNMWALRERNRK